MNAAVRQHPHLERSLSEVRRREAVEYCRGTYHDSADFGPYSYKPRLVSHLERQEVRRVEHERDVPAEALGHRVDPETVKRALADVRDLRKPEIAELSNVVERLYRADTEPEARRVHYAELYQVGVRLADDRFRDVAWAIRENRGALEKTLNERLGLNKESGREVRIAVTDSRVYYWTKDTRQDNWLNGLADQKMYFRTKEDKFGLIEEFGQHLHIRGGPDASQYYLNDLAGQLSRLEDTSVNRFGRYWIHHYFDGETMHLVTDTLRIPLDDVKGRIGYMGISERGRIRNPQFPEIHEWRMRAVAIVASDGSLNPSGQLRYFEDVRDRDRCMIAYEHFCKFGEFKFKPYRGPDGNDNWIRVELPMVIGALMRYWGVPEGDKAIRNMGLPSCIVNESLQVKVYYLPEMVSQDGFFSRGVFGVTRCCALRAGTKGETYRLEYGTRDLVDQHHVDLVREFGKPLPADLTYQVGDRLALSMKTLEELMGSKDPKVSQVAKDLMRIVEANPQRLLQDEVQHIMSPLGIHPAHGPYQIVYYKESGRVSVEWRARTNDVDEALRWALIAPPNHPRKMTTVVKFVANHREKVKAVKAKIIEDGLRIDSVWEDYGV